MRNADASMTRDVLMVGPAFPLRAAWQLMKANRIRHLPVVQTGRLVGILSDRDVLLRATLGSEDGPEVPRDPVALAMTPQPITCTPDTRISHLAALMVERKIDAVPVIGPGDALIGLVTSSDLLALLIDDKPGKVLPFSFRLVDGERREATA